MSVPSQNKISRFLIQKLNEGVLKVFDECARRNEMVVAQHMETMSLAFKQRALQFYPSVLNVDSGDLRRSIAQFTRRSSRGMASGLRNKMPYAWYQEYGTKHIRARNFLSIPLFEVAAQKMNDLKRDIGF